MLYTFNGYRAFLYNRNTKIRMVKIMAGLKYRFEYVKGLVDGFEFMTRYVKVKKVGMLYKGACPFHNEKTPSFYIYPAGHINDDGPQEHASFNCFGCGAGGDIFEFRKRWDQLKSKWEALEAFEKELGIEMEDDEIVTNLLQDQINKIKNAKERVLSLSEINMICSSICRNYLLWVKDNFPETYVDEVKVVDKFYMFFDKMFDEKSAVEAMKVIDDVQIKISNRREQLKISV